MTSYIIAHFKVQDQEGYAAYTKAAIPTILNFGGTTIVADDSVIDLWHGKETSRAIIISFPSREQAKAWFNSPEYRKVSDHRINATQTYTVILVDGFD